MTRIKLSGLGLLPLEYGWHHTAFQEARPGVRRRTGRFEKRRQAAALQKPRLACSLAIRFCDAPRRRVAQPGRQESTAPAGRLRAPTHAQSSPPDRIIIT